MEIWNRVRYWWAHTRKVRIAEANILALPAPLGARKRLQASTMPCGSTAIEVSVIDRTTGRQIRQDCTIVMSREAMSGGKGRI